MLNKERKLASDFMKILAKDVLFQYPKMDQTYHWDSAEQRSVPCAPSAQNAAWSIGFMCSAEQAKEITDQCKEHYAQCKARNPKLGKLSKVFGRKKNDDGTVTFPAKRNAKRKTARQTTSQLSLTATNSRLQIADFGAAALAVLAFWFSQ